MTRTAAPRRYRPPASPQAVTEAPAAARDPFRDLAATELAVEQLRQTQETAPLDVQALVQAIPELTPVPGLDPDVLRVALAALAESHKATAEAAVALVSQAATERGASNGDQLAVRAIDALRALAERPDPPQPQFTVNLPDQSITVPAPVVNVTVPESKPPVVHVSAPPPAEVKVDVHHDTPQQNIVVNVPEQKPQEPPVVHVHVPEQPPAPQPVRATGVTVDYDEKGRKVFVPQYTNPGPSDDGRRSDAA